MTTSLTPALTLDSSVVPKRTLWFYRYKLRRAFYRAVLRQFERLEDEGKLNRKGLACRLGKKNASVITRWFTAPGNWTLDTFSDLSVGMGIDPTTLIENRLALSGTAEDSATEISPLTTRKMEQPPRSTIDPASWLARLVKTEHASPQAPGKRRALTAALDAAIPDAAA